jgi:type I restriction-modification system DNA methylase subunit
MTLFQSDRIYADAIKGLHGLGYSGSLLVENYSFKDWFGRFNPNREIAAAAFGQTPTSYDTALIGIVRADGIHGVELVDGVRSLGAPFILEVDHQGIREWAVSGEQGKHALLATHSADAIKRLFVDRANEWQPGNLLRAKNIGSFKWTQQLGLFTGLLPELEERIQASLDPLLRSTISKTQAGYKATTGKLPDPTQLFKLVFGLLTAKVFRDRKIPGFISSSDPDELLIAVAKKYKEDVPRLLNRHAREIAAELVLNELDFRNLSVEVLSQIWASTLVDEKIKEELGIHRTSRTIVRYIMERIPFVQIGDDKRVVLEPCCGSGVFLVGAMNALRDKLYGATPAQRHDYFVEHLVGIERDPFGAEISRFALTLADFPNPNDWEIDIADVFEGDSLKQHVRQAGVVLCNPPFRDFDKSDRQKYRSISTKPPAELLHRVLNDLHPSGVLGFVLPRSAVDGRGYSPIRRRLAERFANIDITVLPDKAFEADPEVALLVATEPIPHDKSTLGYSRVYDRADSWLRFEHAHEVSFQYSSQLSLDAAEEMLAIPDLPEVWDFLVNQPQLNEVAELHRGIEWNENLTVDGQETGYREKFVRDSPRNGFMIGVPPRSKFNMFAQPELKYLDMRPENQRGHPYKRPWHKPKAILNKSARRRGRWRMAGFADSAGITCYQTFIGVWPIEGSDFDEVLLAAVLNSPVANAFVATREGKTDITMEVLEKIPVPNFTPQQVGDLRAVVREYSSAPGVQHESQNLLMKIDALIFDAYRMPPRLERRVLDFFHGEVRPTPYAFPDYPTWGQDVYFPLSFYLSGRFQAASAGALRERIAL